MDESFSKAARLLSQGRSLFVLTGAGISAESGIPTFRGKDGLWKTYSAEQLATPEAFENDPSLVWDWYRWRQSLIARAEPNPGHHTLVVLERYYKDFLLLTQNVDDLHHRAGSKNILQLHGNIFRKLCQDCGQKVEHGSDHSAGGQLPRCACGGLLRPDVVWFGELIPAEIWNHSLNFLANADVAMICGTSGVVWPAAMIPNIACERGLKTIEINLEKTSISSLVDVSIEGKAGEVLPELVRLMGL